MNDIQTLLAIVIGLVARFAIPVAITALAVAFLRQLDSRWQAQSENVRLDAEALAETMRCADVKNCPPEIQAQCKAISSDLPCWQIRRLPNGYLREECLDCEVFYKAPVPVRA